MWPTKENNNISYGLVNAISRNDVLLKNINMWILYNMFVDFCKDSHHIDGYNDFFGNFKIVLHVFQLIPCRVFLRNLTPVSQKLESILEKIQRI